MNCKQGDLAIVVRSLLGQSIGRVVRCVKLSPISGLRNPMTGTVTAGPVWETDDFSPTITGEVHNLWGDWSLRPIRDPGDDAQDETLSWLPVPHKEHA